MVFVCFFFEGENLIVDGVYFLGVEWISILSSVFWSMLAYLALLSGVIVYFGP